MTEAEIKDLEQEVNSLRDEIRDDRLEYADSLFSSAHQRDSLIRQCEALRDERRVVRKIVVDGVDDILGLQECGVPEDELLARVGRHCSEQRQEVERYRTALEYIDTALMDGVTGDCTVCGKDAGTNKACSACTAYMHLQVALTPPE